MTRLEGSSVSSPNPGPTSARTAEDLSCVPTYSRSERCSVELPLDAAGRWTRTPVSAVVAIALDPQNLPTELLGVGLRGTMGLSRGNVVVSDLVASEMGATIGDVIYLSATANNPVNGSSET